MATMINEEKASEKNYLPIQNKNFFFLARPTAYGSSQG